MINKEFWQRKPVLVTGHTGFKGAWLSLWLKHLGADVTGVALEPPTQPSLYNVANIKNNIKSVVLDINHYFNLKQIVNKASPEIIFHLAAQAIVQNSYKSPLDTFTTNIMGSAHILEAARHSSNLKAVVMVTSDKCYENKETGRAFSENDPMGGLDPYSASKGCAELIISAYRHAFFAGEKNPIGIASARAGNVIGGGDWGAFRLIPDIMESLLNNRVIKIRHPSAVRPWQHVLEPLSGYLLLAQHLYDNPEKFSEAWNFGPDPKSAKPVHWITNKLTSLLGTGEWEKDSKGYAYESTLLYLDWSKARQKMNWRPKLDLDTTLKWIVEWYNAFQKQQDMLRFCFDQIEKYQEA